MSLSTQLTRGVLALPMLLIFAGLGIAASQQSCLEGSEQQLERFVPAAEMVSLSQLAAAAETDRVVALARAAEAASEHASRRCAAAVRSRSLVLAQAPADLGNLAIRWSHACRA